MPCPGLGKAPFSKPQILMTFALHLQTTACSPEADEGYARTTYCSTRRAQKVPRSEQFSAGGKQTRPRKGGFCGAAIVIFALRASLAHCFREHRNGGCAFEREMWMVLVLRSGFHPSSDSAIKRNSIIKFHSESTELPDSKNNLKLDCFSFRAEVFL